MLARMGSLLELEARPMRTPILNDLKDLHMAREALVKNRTAAKNRAKTLALAILKRHNAAQIRQIERQMAAIEKEIMALIKTDPYLGRRFDILVSIPGVSALTAFALLIDMPELGTLDQGQAASLAGLAPVARQSGQWTGRAFIRGGRANVRQALYMPAIVAMRFNPDLKEKYEKLKAAGKPSKVAITAIMRKLIILANALLRDGRNWNQSLH
jgi:transposase